MPDNTKQPREYDAVLGGKNPPPVDGVVLGGLEGAKRSFANSDENYRVLALSQLINYRQEGWDLVIQALKDPSKRVQLAAYKLLGDISELKVKQAILEFNPYRFFECVYTIELNKYYDAAIAIHPDGKTLVCCDASDSSYEESQRDGSIVDGTYLDFKKWDLKTGKSLHTINKTFATRMKDYPEHLTFSSDAQTLAIVGYQHDKTIITEIWNLNTEQLSHLISGQPLGDSRIRTRNTITATTLSSDGKILASGNEAGQIIVWDLENKQNIDITKGHLQRITSVAINADTNILASASYDKPIKIWDFRTGSEIYTLVGEDTFDYNSNRVLLAISPNGKTLITSDHHMPKLIRIWDLITGKEIHKLFSNTDPLRCLTFSADGKIFVSCGGDINIWNLQTQELLAKLPDATSVAISPDGQTIVSYVGKLIQVWRVP
ncbi:WD40 repeat domain-containing protein [Nostoc sp. 'Peltigera membranacea cyanobiont' 232]|uniref:WD40 repeat domain-containing protein n=1 Tax=Nostoc sp. 'Peltigera membranacea cyanobiont' 232 TaxID=2014531 RepID=UPI0016728233|nr:WD40 repeat domain-containing protein [Nostoc sp. 'Peltigera membranacea cyanobiont' 232]